MEAQAALRRPHSQAINPDRLPLPAALPVLAAALPVPAALPLRSQMHTERRRQNARIPGATIILLLPEIRTAAPSIPTSA